MRVCYNDSDICEGFVLSTAEAVQSFGDGRLFIERFIERPHHIEFQIIAATDQNDTTTEVLVFPERECSIQRRNQKVIEESPSLLLNKPTRREMSRQAMLLAKAVGYASAGTIEFLVEGTKVTNKQIQKFYFLEMNTRLQVEHPVTEMVTSIDLVEQMFRVAANKYFGPGKENMSVLSPSLLQAQNENDDEGVVPYRGWALEARVYAEDPLRNFLPSTGPLLKYEEPCTADVSKMMEDDKNSIAVRVDSGVGIGSNISMFYDPMISKLVTYSDGLYSNREVRAQAIDAMMYALQRYVVVGVQSNISFLSHVVSDCGTNSASRAFREGKTPTSFIDTHYPNGFSEEHLPVISSLNRDKLSEDVAVTVISASLFSLFRKAVYSEAFKLSSHQRLIVVIGGFFGSPYEVSFSDVCNSKAIVKSLSSGRNDSYEAYVGDLIFDRSGATTVADLIVNEKRIVIQLHDAQNDGSLRIQINGSVVDVVVRSVEEHTLTYFMKKPPSVDTSLMILSPMPGKLVSFAVDVSA